MSAKRGRRDKSTTVLPEEEIALFRQAVVDVRPLRRENRVHHAPQQPWPERRRRSLDEQSEEGARLDGLSDHIPWLNAFGSMESSEALTFQRPGLTRRTLKNLSQGHWPIQSEIDLHGHTSDEARQQLVFFLNECQHLGLRCVRVIHGKGLRSENREPVLKLKTVNWLMQREAVLAFCQARPSDGGGGALIVLLKAARRS